MSSTTDRERDFHNAWASSTPIEQRRVVQAFESSTAPENRFILQRMGELSGKKVLDVGCGLGESSVYFALKKAEVSALDLSPKMVETTVQLGKEFGVTINGIVGSAERLDVESDFFDFVYLGNIIHHVENRENLFREIRRVLKPGGTFFSWDPLTYNPLINIYRAIATETRTPDERPLSRRDLSLVKRHFSRVSFRTFWLTSLTLFLKYACIDRVDPNKERYWKKILDEPEDRLSWFRLLQRLDRYFLGIPGLRWLAWNIVICGQKTA
jgi:ubiquinone/menaquinone biosynthesis C-methylase UbiE